MISKSKIMKLREFNRDIFGISDNDIADVYAQNASTEKNIVNKKPQPISKNNHSISEDSIVEKVTNKLSHLIGSLRPQEINTEKLVEDIKREVKGAVANSSHSVKINPQIKATQLDAPNIVLTEQNNLVTSGKIGEEQKTTISTSELDMLFDMTDGK